MSADDLVRILRALAWAVLDGVRAARDGLDIVILAVAVARILGLEGPDDERIARAWERDRTTIAHRRAKVEARLRGVIRQQL